MNSLFLGIVIFLIVLAVFDLVVGVSNDAVNFLNSAVGAKVAKFRTIILVAAIGVAVGAALSNGMMDVARHGIMMPEHFSFYDVMCVFLAVMVTDVILLDVFNSLGMPTSTTVSMVFEMLGGAFGVALIRIVHGATDANGVALTLGDLINTEKALSVIMGIFLSVAVAFVMGSIVQWLARIIFTFTYRVNGKTTDANGTMGGLTSSSLKIGIFGGVAVTSIVWFLLINGLKGSSIMTADLKATIENNTWLILGGGLALFSIVMTVMSAFKLPVLKIVVLFGTFALAMAFAGNDLVNFVGVPLTGLEAFNEFSAHGHSNASEYMMTSLMGSAHTPVLYLALAGLVMVLSLVFSKKAQNVLKTSVDLSRQDEGDEMFGSSAVARVIVRNAQKMSSSIGNWIPKSVVRWIDSRFNSDAAVLPQDAAFDQIRASVNLVLAGLLVAVGTSWELPLSTTYVTFMVAMGSSLADRAWSRESAVFRITGVLSVIGGWFITAGAAFVMCFIVTNALHFGSFLAMAIAVIVAIVVLVRSNLRHKSERKADHEDVLFRQLCRSQDKAENWTLLKAHVQYCLTQQLQFTHNCFNKVSYAFLHEEYKPLRQSKHEIETAHKQLKRLRRREIVGLRRIDPILSTEKNTWYWLVNSSAEQMLYCLKRINDPCCEHVGNNFSPVCIQFVCDFEPFRSNSLQVIAEAQQLLSNPDIDFQSIQLLRAKADDLQEQLSLFRNQIINTMQRSSANIESSTTFLNMVQETQQLLCSLRLMFKGFAKLTDLG